MALKKEGIYLNIPTIKKIEGIKKKEKLMGLVFKEVHNEKDLTEISEILNEEEIEFPKNRYLQEIFIEMLASVVAEKENFGEA